MQFTTFQFGIFFPIVIAIYYVIPKRARAVWLLFVSMYFYLCWNVMYGFLILASILITYLGGIGLDRVPLEKTNKRKCILGATIVSNLGILVFFKYFYFLFDSISRVCSIFSISLKNPQFDIILPIGISFYTFQALGYAIDVYRGDVKAEKNIIYYALFVSFFPQLVAGPIERSEHLIKQLHEITQERRWDFDQFTRGLLMLLWGYFMKLVIADRAAIFVNQVFQYYYAYYGVMLILGAILFVIQLYCDFASYSAIAIGAAAMLGVELIPNFAAPLLSKSVGEFWRRWHMSLSYWLRDYVYIPLGGSRCTTWKKHRNRLITFFVSGLWHGASWHFVVWGVLQGFFIFLEELLKPICDKIVDLIGVKVHSIGIRLCKVLITDFLVVLAFVFFRANSVGEAVIYIKRILIHFDPWSVINGSIYQVMDHKEFIVLGCALLFLFLVDFYYQKTKRYFDSLIKEQCLAIQYFVVISMILVILIFGIYGEGYDATQFIYFQF